MSHEGQAELDALFDDAEARSTCLVPPNRAIEARLRRRLSSGEVLSPCKGIYVRAPFWKLLDLRAKNVLAMRALGKLHPSWVFCGPSAAVVHGLYVSWNLLMRLHATPLPGSCNTQRALEGVILHRPFCATSTVVAGMRVTPLDETAIDCLCGFPFLDGLGIADSWMRFSDRSSRQALQLIDKHAAHKRGVIRARLVAQNGDGRAENGGESKARALMLACGYEAPDLQVEIPDVIDGGEPKRVDFLWRLADGDGTRVVGELDGAIKYRDPAVMDGMDAEMVRERERLRESRIAMPGTAVMRFSMDDVRDHARFCRILDSYGVPRTPESVRLARAIAAADRAPARYAWPPPLLPSC